MDNYDEFITALSKGKAWDEFKKNRDRYLLGDRHLSDIGRPSPGPQYVLNSGFGDRRQGIVLDPNYEAEYVSVQLTELDSLRKQVTNRKPTETDEI